MVKASLVLLGSLMLNCSSSVLPTHYELRLDPSLSAVQSELVIDAMTDWSVHAGKRITFTPVVSSEHCGDSLLDSGGCIHVEYASKEAVNIKCNNKNPAGTFIGCTVEDDGLYGGSSNVYVVELDMPVGNGFMEDTAAEARNIEHEGGHAIGAAHSGVNNRMSPSFKDESTLLTDDDVNQVLRAHNLPLE